MTDSPSEPGRPALQIPPNCDVLLGLRCVDKSVPGVTVWEMDADERFANPVGAVQGGIVTALADTAMSASAVTYNKERKVFVANTDLRISFFKPARTGQVLTCTATAVAGGRRTTFVEAELTDADGVVIARASSTYLLTARD
ncbi:PaaI family thioesterase [Acidiferrimicrobium sp. IK]|uniref:PaaI family thioesterase n=1 Tax=Acidiferrimicrobium sp. IK TaxID=2871700 RepID=UPI0021CB6D3F|nr:PaaI family thioesterase [Acidiferrimicrobium sp. IK]MCU4185859.1 PaaI family thioesterase [Acidiferrimicrobium sp. IK]